MSTKFDPPYPLNGLTPRIRALANYIHKANQSPISMCAISALAGCTLAAQGLIKVKWRNAPASPVSMIFVVEALSGERKTSNDQIALEEHRRFDKKQSQEEANDTRTHALAEAIWALKKKTILRAIIQSPDEKKAHEHEELLYAHERERPPIVKLPRMLISDITAPAIARHLSEKYPYAGLVSDEGGVILSSGALSNPAMINSIWDYGGGVTDRMGRGRTEVYDASLTIYLQVQPGVFENFLSRQNNIAHASGNSSRWLYAKPESMLGKKTNEYTDLPEEDRDAYNMRIREMLNHYKDALPARTTKTLTDAARQSLRFFSQAIEEELTNDGHFAFMQGTAVKAPENCARLAAVMQEFENGISDVIGDEAITGAIKIVAWHLNQYRMRFAPFTQMELDVQDLEESIFKNYHRWEKTKGDVKGSELARYAPKRLRQIDKLLSVVLELSDQGKVKVWAGKTGGWHVVLEHWFPGDVSTPQGGAQQPPRYHPQRERKLAQQRAADEAAERTEELRRNSREGYELWPGCFL